jgi:hypothetical protein
MPSRSKDIERLFQETLHKQVHASGRSTATPGKTTGLAFYPFMYKLFAHQEERSQDTKITDDHIREMVRKEFGDYSLVWQNILKKKVHISGMRAHYNQRKPPMLSLGYDHAGFPQSGAYRPMKMRDVRRKCFHYKIVDPRFFTPAEIATISSYIVRKIQAYAGFRLPTVTEIELFPYGSIQFLDADTIGLQILEREMAKRNGSTK